MLRAGCVTEMASSVNGMLSYKWLSADLRVDQPCVCVHLHLCIHPRQFLHLLRTILSGDIHTHTHCKVCGKNSDGQ